MFWRNQLFKSGHNDSRKGGKMCSVAQELADENAEKKCKRAESLNLGTPRSKIKSATETRTRAKTRGRFQQKI